MALSFITNLSLRINRFVRKRPTAYTAAFSNSNQFSSSVPLNSSFTDNSQVRPVQITINYKDVNENNFLKYLIKMSQNNQRNLRIAIEGNISSGKSSIINYLKGKVENREEPALEAVKILSDETNCEILTGKLNNRSLTANKSPLDFLKQSNVTLKIIPEPVHLWRNLNGNNLLDLMYSDPEKWAFPFHSYVQLTMLENHLELRGDPQFQPSEGNENAAVDMDDLHINIMERSLYSAKYCFAENLHRSGVLKTPHYEILDKWFRWMTENHDCHLDIIFYLRTDPEVCMQRLHKRGRPEETQCVSLDYLQSIHDLHEQWLGALRKENSGYYRPPTVIVIDGDQSIDEVYKIIEMETRNAVTLAN